MFLREPLGLEDEVLVQVADGTRVKLVTASGEEFGEGSYVGLTSSMHHDLERGNPLEVEWLAGGVVELGAAVGVATPANRAVWDILALHAEGRSKGCGMRE